MMQDLFGDIDAERPRAEKLAPGALLLRGRALPMEKPILAALDEILAEAPFRRMITPGGFAMSVAMTNCGAAGWVTDRRGYRYDPLDPESGRPWPPPRPRPRCRRCPFREGPALNASRSAARTLPAGSRIRA